jgi:hypothetical protein
LNCMRRLSEWVVVGGQDFLETDIVWHL